MIVKGRPVSAKRYLLCVCFLQLPAVLGLVGCQGQSGGVALPEGAGESVLSDVERVQVDVGDFSGATDEAAYWGQLVRGRLKERLGGGGSGGGAKAGRQVVSGEVTLSQRGRAVSGCASGVRVEVVFELRKGADGALVERVMLARWAQDKGSDAIWYSLSALADAYCERYLDGPEAGEIGFAEGQSEYDRLGRQAGVRHDWAEAQVLFRQAVDAHPDDDAALYNSGLVCEALGDYEGALGYYDRALAVRPRALYAGARNRARTALVEGR